MWLAQQLAAAPQATAPGVWCLIPGSLASSSSSSSHGVGNTAAVPDPECRFHSQHGYHDRGGGQCGILGGVRDAPVSDSSEHEEGDAAEGGPLIEAKLLAPLC